MKKYYKIIILAFLPLMFGCEPEIENQTPQPGEADFSVMVALGNSLTAGFSDLELFASGQQHSYPALMARQLSHVGLEDFNQPLMYDETGFGQRIKLGYTTDCLNQTSLGPVPFGGDLFPGNFAWLGNNLPYHNLGVPAARIGHLLTAGYGMANPYFGRFAIDPSSSSVLSDAVSHNPTFFTLWIGNNDVLGYALNGGEANTITSADNFRNSYRSLLEGLTAQGAKGAIANIAYITDSPLFTTIPYNGLVLTTEEQVNALNSAYANVPHVNFAMGQNGFVVADSENPYTLRQMQPGELLLLSVPQDSLKCFGYGTAIPIPQKHYLSLDQVNQINTAIDSYNVVIATKAGEFDLALVDLNTLMQTVESGIYYDGLNFSTQYITGGVFSIDGVHLTKRGNAIVANHFIEAINSKYGSTIPRLTVSEFEGIIFP